MLFVSQKGLVLPDKFQKVESLHVFDKSVAQNESRISLTQHENGLWGVGEAAAGANNKVLLRRVKFNDQGVKAA